MYSLGTWFVSGICVWIPYIKKTMMMVMMMIMAAVCVLKETPAVPLHSARLARAIRKNINWLKPASSLPTDSHTVLVLCAVRALYKLTDAIFCYNLPTAL